mmetsp:Transcript_53607/g.135392  ORF Transcript_53607/g.135392 Transcript_53607/m.135392 type:complete len:265 (-) Transcript_53607:126-920(-)
MGQAALGSGVEGEGVPQGPVSSSPPRGEGAAHPGSGIIKSAREDQIPGKALGSTPKSSDGISPSRSPSKVEVVQGGSPVAGHGHGQGQGGGDVLGNELRRRATWEPGSVVEVYCSSLGQWCVGLVANINKDGLLTVRFADKSGGLLAKNLVRSDMQLATFGSNTSELPPGVQAVPSQSRPGQMSYLDTAAALKFHSLELAWRHHLERLIDPTVDPRKYAGPPTSRNSNRSPDGASSDGSPVCSPAAAVAAVAGNGRWTWWPSGN